MGRVLLAVGAALVLLIGAGVAAIALTEDDDYVATDNLLAERLSLAVGLAEERDEEVDLRTLAPFRWDDVLLVENGTPREEISRALGFPFEGDIGFQIGPLLVFRNRAERRMRFTDYRGEGEFQEVRTPIEVLPRDRAVFKVRALGIWPRDRFPPQLERPG